MITISVVCLYVYIYVQEEHVRMGEFEGTSGFYYYLQFKII